MKRNARRVKVPKGTWLNFVENKLRLPSTNIQDVMRATGLPYFWLLRLKAGDIPDPSVNRVQILHSYFENLA